MPESPEAPAPPVCPRHPDRESYVRCQRCERPACPECQRAAAVGFQCVDCVREQNKGVRQARTVFGGGLSQGRPLVTLAIIGICAVVWALQLTDGRVTEWFWYAPAQTASEPWRMLSAAFLHSPQTPLHILFNMYALYVTGPYLEALFGRARYLALYLICAFGGSVGFLLLASPDGDAWFTPTVGASGAVFGLFGAFFMVQRAMNRDTGQIIGVVVLNLVIGFAFPGIAWQAHLGGLATGVVAAAVLAYAPKARRAQAQWAGLAALVVLLALLTVAKAATGPLL